jgi:hypothetical protein
MTIAGRSHDRTFLWVGASAILSAGSRFVPDNAVGFRTTLFVLSGACTLAAAATIDWRVIPWKRAEFFLLGAMMVVLAVLAFVKASSTSLALVVVVAVLFVAAVVMMIRGLVDMFRMVRRARADKTCGPS